MIAPLSTGGTYRAALPSLWAGYCAAVFVPSNLDTGAVPGEGRGRRGIGGSLHSLDVWPAYKVVFCLQGDTSAR